jgi:hypothetical protein
MDGGALLIRARCDDDTLRLTVNAHEAALTEYTRDRVPFDWAAPQSNLGLALASLGERESRTAHLREVVAAWEAHLTMTASTWPQGRVQDVRSHIAQARADNDQ